MNASFVVKGSLLMVGALASLGADDFRQVPKFAGKAVPDPPRQKTCPLACSAKRLPTAYCECGGWLESCTSASSVRRRCSWRRMR
jgi:hypothetical protein